MIRISSKSQTWSLDILIAASIFIVGIIVFLYVISSSKEGDMGEVLSTDSEVVSETLIAIDENTASPIAPIIGNKVDSVRLEQLAAMDYEDIKNALGIASEFCIHFEDERGNIVDIDDDPGVTRYSIGSSKLNITLLNSSGGKVNRPCGS
ncbi:MAG: hypothetical protein ABIG95_02400 [Candidatus Woesearchaeota archaeon]